MDCKWQVSHGIEKYSIPTTNIKPQGCLDLAIKQDIGAQPEQCTHCYAKHLAAAETPVTGPVKGDHRLGVSIK